MPYKPGYSDLPIAHSKFHLAHFKRSRQSLLSELRCLSGVPEAVRSLNPDVLYKVIVPEGKLLQQGKDGVFRGVFHGDSGRIEQHAKFSRMSRSFMEAAKTMGSQVLLVSIAMQLNRIEKMVECLSEFSA